MQKHKKAFTLVELIVVITILAILGTIAFISLQGYSQDARDSVRISDISKIKTSLELFQLDAGKYPETTTPTNITYSGAIAWTQGMFGDLTFNNVTKLDKIPLDPITDRQYIYSVTNTKQEYQIAGIMEGDEITSLFNQTNSAQKTAILKISGNYNGKVLKVSTGSIDYVLAVPSIITSSGFTVDQIVSSKFLAYNGYKNLPAQYAGSSYDVLGDSSIKLINSSDLVVYSGDLETLSSTQQVGIDARKNLIENLQNAYSGTAITNVGEIAQIINTDTENTNTTEFLGATIVNNNLGGSVSQTNNNVISNNTCATQPEYVNANFIAGTPTSIGQAWQNTNIDNPCYYTCDEGFTGSTCSSICTYTYSSSIIGTTGAGPYGIITDESGNIYTVNQTSNNVTKITPLGVSSIFGTTGTYPWGITMDASGNIYTTNQNSHNVTKITPSGVSSIFGTTGSYPRLIVIDASGNLYISNGGSGNVTKITPSGVSSILGTTGIVPWGITLDASGNIYTANSSSNNVTKITPSGVSSILGTTGVETRGITIDAFGNIYTANGTADNITKITPSGVSSILGTTGTYPYGITIDASGNIYTANRSSNNVTKITPSGVTSILGTTGTNPSGITIDASGNIYTSNNGSNNVTKLTRICN